MNAVDWAVVASSISASATVSGLGQWAAIPQDFSSGSLTTTMVLTTPSPLGTSTLAAGAVGVSVGLTWVWDAGVIGAVGLYCEDSGDFGWLDSLGLALSSSFGLSGAVDVLVVSGPISLLDGLGALLVVDVGLEKTLFTGFGILLAPSGGSWNMVGFLLEAIGIGLSAAPPVSVGFQLSVGEHGRIQLF